MASKMKGIQFSTTTVSTPQSVEEDDLESENSEENEKSEESENAEEDENSEESENAEEDEKSEESDDSEEVESSEESEHSDESESDDEKARSSEESSSCSHEAEEEESSADEEVIPFKLKCVHNLNEEEKGERFMSYLKGPSLDKETFRNRTKQKKLAVDFSPWWENLETEPKSQNSMKADHTVISKDDDSYESWFSRCQSGDVSNWISGPSTSKANRSGKEVEDIEVPSIYDMKPKEKGRRAQKRQRKAERDKTTGKNWFEMKAPDVDEKMRMDMDMIRMRGALDPKRFFKKSDRQGLPKYFQMGTVMDEGTDFYSSRLTKKQRKQTLVEELMADANIRQFNKKKYAELQQKKRGKKFRNKKTA